MFFVMPELHLDPLWPLTKQFNEDERADKLNLVLGVYRDDNGICPIPRAVQQAEVNLAAQARDKEYTSPAGNALFNELMTDLIFADSLRADGVEEKHVSVIQAVGGTGALRLISDLLFLTGPDRTVYLGTPAYVNHPAIFGAARLNVVEYSLEEGGLFAPEKILETVRNAKAGDVVILHGSCYNPTGFNMGLDTWSELGKEMAARGVIPLIDHAYFGLGDGLDEDLLGMREMLRFVPKAFVAVSGAKAFGLYNERVGAAFIVSNEKSETDYGFGIMEVLARAMYSQAASHGASVVAEILGDDNLKTMWLEELREMRERLNSNREEFVNHIVSITNDDKFLELKERRGMFLTLPLTSEDMKELREEHAIYGVPSGRINVSAIPTNRVKEVAEAIGRLGRQ